MKKRLSALAAAGLVFAFATTASAHVTVWPKETTTGAYEKYTVRVPVEKDSNTTKVRVEFPANVKVSTVQPTAGWNYEFEKNAEGYNKAVVWTATADGIKPHEFNEFYFIGANPKEAGTLTWRASQTYADGTVVDWAGAPDSKTPASVTMIHQGAAGGDSHTTDTAVPNQEAAPDASTEGTSNNLPLILSGAALLIALISLFRKRA
jgi:uncharacterized protein YcnI